MYTEFGLTDYSECSAHTSPDTLPSAWWRQRVKSRGTAAQSLKWQDQSQQYDALNLTPMPSAGGVPTRRCAHKSDMSISSIDWIAGKSIELPLNHAIGRIMEYCR